jgi:hypothetical protein
MRVTASGRRAAAVFYLVNVLLFPITLIGYVLWLARIYLGRRAGGASTTAQGPLSARAFMHQLGLRRDEAAYRLLMALPSTSGLGVLLAGGPVLLAHRLTGYVPRAFRYPFEGEVPPQYEASARVAFVDAAVARCLATIDQFVMLGAGFDTRAFRLPRPGQIRCFEVDTPQTQACGTAEPRAYRPGGRWAMLARCSTTCCSCSRPCGPPAAITLTWCSRTCCCATSLPS